MLGAALLAARSSAFSISVNSGCGKAPPLGKRLDFDVLRVPAMMSGGVGLSGRGVWAKEPHSVEVDQVERRCAFICQHNL